MIQITNTFVVSEANWYFIIVFQNGIFPFPNFFSIYKSAIWTQIIQINNVIFTISFWNVCSSNFKMYFADGSMNSMPRFCS